MGIKINFIFMCSFGSTPLFAIPTAPPRLVSVIGPFMTIANIAFAPSALCLSPLSPGYVFVAGSGPCIPLISWLANSTNVTILGIPALSILSKGRCNTGNGVIIPIPTDIKSNIMK